MGERNMNEAFIGSGLSGIHGNAYQLKLLMLFLKRAVDKGYDFTLTSEIKAAGKFDDVVLKYHKDGENLLVLVQAKHKQDSNKLIRAEHLIQTDKKTRKRKREEGETKINDDYSLAKYFISYLMVKRNPDFADSVLKNIIICTNICFDLELCPDRGGMMKLNYQYDEDILNGYEIFVVPFEDDDEFFRDEDGGERYKFHYDSDNMVSTWKPFFTQILNKEIKRIKNDKKRGAVDESDQTLQNTLEQISGGDLQEEIKQFFDILIFAVNQPDETKLTEIIKNALSREFNKIEARHIYLLFHEWMTDWLKGRQNHFITREDGIRFFAELKEEINRCFHYNVRQPIESFVGREEKLTEIRDSLSKEEPAVICQKVSISGMGGIGKTELVRKYIAEFGHEYHNVIWIDSEDRATMEESFKDIATSLLGISVDKRDIKLVVKDVYNFFTRRKCLFVFDNAEKFRGDNAGIMDFLPSFILPRGSNSPKVLITSRNTSWGKTPPIVLGVFTEEEASDFITKGLDIKDSLKHDEVKMLAEKLQYFPLALQQAVAYIKVKNTELSNVGSEFHIKDYIDRYDKETRNLLDFEFPEDSNDAYTKTTFSTMIISINKINENKEHGKQARDILDIIALLAPDNIPVDMFLQLEQINGDKEMLGSTIQLLKQYSLISSGEEKTRINIHRLMQQVIRIRLRDQNREQDTFKNGLKILKEYIRNTYENKGYSLLRQILTHSESFISFLDDWSRTFPNNKETADSYLIELQPCMTLGYDSLGNPLKNKELLKKVVEILKKIYGDHHYKVAVALHNLGEAYGDLGNPFKQKELLEIALEIKKKHYGDDHCEVAVLLNNLGNAYNALGNPLKQKELLEEALEIKEKHFGDNHLEVAVTLVNLGNAYSSLGDPLRQKELLEKALEISVKHYGHEHYEVGKILSNLGNAYSALGNPLKQKDLLEKALKILKKHYGDDHYEVGTILNNLSYAYGALRNPLKQKELSEQALEILIKHYGECHYRVAETLINLSNGYGALGNPQRKKMLLEQALDIQTKYYSGNHYIVAVTLNNLGNAYSLLGDPLKGIELFEQSLEIKKNHYSENHDEVVMTLNNLAIAHGQLANASKQIELLEHVLEIIKNIYGDIHYKVAEALRKLSDAYGASGNPTKQKELLEQSFEIQMKLRSLAVRKLLSNLGNASNTIILD